MKTFTLKSMAASLCLCLCCLSATAADENITIVIPATGHLAFKPNRNFSGPASITVSNFYGSGNSTSPGLKFNNQVLGEGVVIAQAANSNSAFILTAQPGTYELTLTDQAATKQFYSTSAYWSEESGQIYRKDYCVYKFVNTVGHVGFERDEKYAAQNYQYCDLAEGEHLFFPVGEKAMERITTTLQTTAAELQFIPWSEAWSCPMIDASAGIDDITMRRSSNTQYYDLQGRRLNGQPARGLYITNGKKLLAK